MTAITSKPNKAAALARVQALIAGTLKQFPNGSFTLGNTAYTTASLVQALQNLEQALVAVNTAQASVKDAMTALRMLEPTAGPLMRNYERFLHAMFSTATQPLADFGLQPLKGRKPLDSESRTAMAAKMRATRAARGTMGKKQKLAIKGNVTGIVVTPVTAPPSTSPTPPAAPPEPTASPAAAPSPAPAQATPLPAAPPSR